jgi:hypothetical protein
MHPMLTDTDGIPSDLVNTQKLEILIFFVVVFHLPGPTSVRQNRHNDRHLVIGNLSQVRANLGIRPMWQYSSSGSSGNNKSPVFCSMHSEGGTSHIDLLSVALLVKRTSIFMRKYFGHVTWPLFPGRVERHSAQSPIICAGQDDLGQAKGFRKENVVNKLMRQKF